MRPVLRFGLPMLAVVGTVLAPTTTLASATPKLAPAIADLGQSVPLATEVVSATDVWTIGTHHHRHSTSLNTIYASHWDGAVWTVYPTPNPGLLNNQVTDIDAVSSTDIWAVGGYSDVSDGPLHTLVLHWDGQGWTQIPSHDVGATGSWLSSVSVVSPTDVWAVGDVIAGFREGSSLTEHWNGHRWRVVNSPNVNGAADTSLGSVTAVTASDIWAVGSSTSTDHDVPLAEHWNGSKWKIVPMADLDGHSGYLVSIYAAAADDVWAVGVTRKHTLIAHWDGSSWTAVDAPKPGKFSQLHGIDGTSPTNIWAVGSQWAGGPDPLLIEHWDGSAWSDVSISDRPGGSDGSLYGIATDAPDDAWTVGQEYDPAAGHDGTGGFVQVRLHWDGTGWS